MGKNLPPTPSQTIPDHFSPKSIIRDRGIFVKLRLLLKLPRLILKNTEPDRTGWVPKIHLTEDGHTTDTSE
jgi:hypothetical protein